MARKTTVGHDVGDGTLDARARADGYEYARIAENVAGGYQTLAEAFSGWRDSPDHKKNMLMPSATRIGIAGRTGSGIQIQGVLDDGRRGTRHAAHAGLPAGAVAVFQ